MFCRDIHTHIRVSMNSRKRQSKEVRVRRIQVECPPPDLTPPVRFPCSFAPTLKAPQVKCPLRSNAPHC